MYFYPFKKNLVQKRCYDYDEGSAIAMSGSEDATDRGVRSVFDGGVTKESFSSIFHVLQLILFKQVMITKRRMSFILHNSVF